MFPRPVGIVFLFVVVVVVVAAAAAAAALGLAARSWHFLWQQWTWQRSVRLAHLEHLGWVWSMTGSGPSDKRGPFQQPDRHDSPPEDHTHGPERPGQAPPRQVHRYGGAFPPQGAGRRMMAQRRPVWPEPAQLAGWTPLLQVPAGDAGDCPPHPPRAHACRHTHTHTKRERGGGGGGGGKLPAGRTFLWFREKSRRSINIINILHK